MKALKPGLRPDTNFRYCQVDAEFCLLWMRDADSARMWVRMLYMKLRSYLIKLQRGNSTSGHLEVTVHVAILKFRTRAISPYP